MEDRPKDEQLPTEEQPTSDGYPGSEGYPDSDGYPGSEGGAGEDDVLPDTEPVGPDNIREGRVRGVMGGGPTHSEGQGQGG